MDKENLNELKGGALEQKCFIEAPETHPDILRGGHRNPYQLENATKRGGIVFLLISLGLNSLPGSCDYYVSSKSVNTCNFTVHALVLCPKEIFLSW